MCFNTKFWNEKYLSGQTGWDIKAPSTPIKEYIDQLNNKDLKILIPGCGNAYEAEYLIQNGFTNITLVDLSSVLCEHLREKFSAYSQVKILNDNYFNLNGSFDLIIEQTFFCALEPNLRLDYVNKTYELLAKNGRLVGLLFNKTFGNPYPPFGGTITEYELLFKDQFKFKHFGLAKNSIKPREGSELFICLTKN